MFIKGSTAVFESQRTVRPYETEHLLSHGYRPELVAILGYSCYVEGDPITMYQVRANDGCEFWVSPGELKEYSSKD